MSGMKKNRHFGTMKWLVGGAITILKNMKVNGKDYPIYEMENKKCLKPPTKLQHFLCKDPTAYGATGQN